MFDFNLNILANVYNELLYNILIILLADRTIVNLFYYNLTIDCGNAIFL